MDDDDWRLSGQDEYLTGRALKWATWTPYREGWDHDHCEFCWAKFTDRPVSEADDHIQHHEGWVTADDNYYWICAQCCTDFKERFGWLTAT